MINPRAQYNTELAGYSLEILRVADLEDKEMALVRADTLCGCMFLPLVVELYRLECGCIIRRKQRREITESPIRKSKTNETDRGFARSLNGTMGEFPRTDGWLVWLKSRRAGRYGDVSRLHSTSCE